MTPTVDLSCILIVCGVAFDQYILVISTLILGLAILMSPFIKVCIPATLRTLYVPPGHRCAGEPCVGVAHLCW